MSEVTAVFSLLHASYTQTKTRQFIYSTVNFTRNSAMEVGALSAARSAWFARGRHATVGSGRGWLGVVTARQADLSGRLGSTGHCTSTGRVLVYAINHTPCCGEVTEHCSQIPQETLTTVISRAG